jgi:serine/threonine protein kinase
MRGNDFTQASDIYALGLVLWEIITGKVPFAEYGRGRNEIMYQVLRGARPYVEISDSVPPAYYQLMEACWADDVSSRPDSAYIVYELYLNCWLYTVHSKIVETIHTIDNKTLIECYEAERSNMAIKTAFSNYRPQNRRGSMPLVVSQALLTVRRESQWEMLEQAGAFLILSAEFPFLVLGATKKWSQITGFLLSDIIARDLSFLEGTLSNK